MQDEIDTADILAYLIKEKQLTTLQSFLDHKPSLKEEYASFMYKEAAKTMNKGVLLYLYRTLNISPKNAQEALAYIGDDADKEEIKQWFLRNMDTGAEAANRV